MIRKKVTIVKIRFPTGREEEIPGTDYKARSELYQALKAGAVIIERRKDLYTLDEDVFCEVAEFKRTIEREEIK